MRYLMLLLTIIVGLTGMASADANTELACPTQYRPDTGTYAKMWECPSLPNYTGGSGSYDLKHDLLNVDYETGAYSCGYKYPDTNQYAQSCRYVSETFVKMKNTIRDKMYGTVGDGGSTLGKFNLVKVVGDHTVANSPVDIDFEADFNLVGVTAPSFITSVFQPKVNALIAELQSALIKASNPNTALYSVETDLQQLKNLSYKHLVEPYYKPASLDAMNKEHTFSNFLAGLVTLNDEMVSGYDEGTGKLIIDSAWKAEAFTISPTSKGLVDQLYNGVSATLKNIGSFFGFTSSSPETNDALTNTKNVLDTMGGGYSYDLRVGSWLDIFEMKVWGFYYNFQRRFDLGYDVISTQLLYIMSMWFILMAGTRTGIGHIINREQGVKVTEDNWMKGLGMLVGIGLFFISLSTPVTSQNIEGSGTINQEMSKNKTIVKYIIRQSADMGANFGTMLSDLGLDAFLSFVVKKQNIVSVSSVVDNFQSTLFEMSMYYPAYETVTVCRKQYGLTDVDFLNSVSVPSPVKDWDTVVAPTVPYMANNNVSYLSYALCQKAYKIVAMMPNDLAYAIAETQERINDADTVTARAMYLLATNQIIMQDKVGWVNTFSVPASYFIMKHNDMFLSKGVDYESVEKSAKSMVSALGIKNNGDIPLSVGGGEGAVGLAWNRMSDSFQEYSAKGVSMVSSLLLWNILPAYSQIRTSIYDWFESVHDGKLQVVLSEKDSDAGGNIKDLLTDTIKKFLGGASGVGFLYKMVSILPDVDNIFIWKSVITFASLFIAQWIWKSMFTIMFIATISIMLLLKTVLYFKDLILHIVTSVFVVVWAFAKQGGQGESKMATFLRDTLVLMIYPSLIVLSSYVFIFVYEFFSTVYTYLMGFMLEGQKANISLMTAANSGTSTFSAYMNIYSLEQFSEIMVMVFGFIIAVITIMQLPEYALKKLGISENETMMISGGAEKVHSKGEKFSNPL